MSAAELLSCIEIDPPKAAQWSVIWLHGLGADGHDFESIPPFLRLEPRHPIRFVLPHAPSIPVTLNGGMRMPAWYDIRDGDLRTRHDEVGIARSAEQVRALLAREIERGVPSNHVFLAGFSQGGAIAAYTALRHPQPLAGVIALSTYLVCGDTLPAELQSANRGIPVFAAHGTRDPMVHAKRGEELRDTLTKLGCRVEWHTYPMEHSVCMEELVDIGAWMNRLMSA
ncbi:MAG: alpha/beta hydrolase [Planctomycetes bacterium]|nr:alpha/beta hydrolase [Planctomycetota bacterium]